MREIVLINPCFEPGYNTSNVPLSLAVLGGYLEESGINCDIIDPFVMKMSWEDVVRKAKEYEIVGFTSFTHTRENTLRLARDIKSANPASTIVLGGPHASCLDEAILRYSEDVDIVIRGEGEEPLRMVCEEERLERIPGATYREDGGIKKNPESRPIEDLDKLPFPSYHKFPIDEYIPFYEGQKDLERLTHVGVTTSRGCPFKCIFCASASRFKYLWRSMSPKRVGELLQYLYDDFHVRYFRFFDDNFTVSKKRVIKVCDEILSRKLDISFRIEARVDSLNEEMLRALKKAGCHLMEIGIESGSDRILRNLNKKITSQQVRDAVRLSRKHGIATKGFLMVNLPGERMSDVMETMKISVLPDFITVAILTLLPGAPITERLKAEGRFDDSIWFERSGDILYSKEFGANFSLRTAKSCYYLLNLFPALYRRDARNRALDKLKLRLRMKD